MTSIPCIGQMKTTQIVSTTRSSRLAGMPALKNSPDVNCLLSYAMALGAAPTRTRRRQMGILNTELTGKRFNCDFNLPSTSVTVPRFQSCLQALPTRIVKVTFRFVLTLFRKSE